MKHLKSGNAKNLKRLITACVAAVAIIVTASCHGRHGGSTEPRNSTNTAEVSKSMQNEKQATVSGNVYYLQRIALPPDALIDVYLFKGNNIFTARKKELNLRYNRFQYPNL